MTRKSSTSDDLEGSIRTRHSATSIVRLSEPAVAGGGRRPWKGPQGSGKNFD